jgi:hypothetical protein
MVNNTIKTRLCPYSKTMFEAKRQNQIYRSASDRISHNNLLNNLLRKKLSFINKQLLKNYKIADALIADFNDVSVHKQFLRGKGFSFQMFTHVSQKEDEIVYGLYDISFMKLTDEDYYYLYRTK